MGHIGRGLGMLCLLLLLSCSTGLKYYWQQFCYSGYAVGVGVASEAQVALYAQQIQDIAAVHPFNDHKMRLLYFKVFRQFHGADSYTRVALRAGLLRVPSATFMPIRALVEAGDIKGIIKVPPYLLLSHDQQGRTLVHYAVEAGRLNLLIYMLRVARLHFSKLTSTLLNARDENGMTADLLAIALGSHHITRTLIYRRFHDERHLDPFLMLLIPKREKEGWRVGDPVAGYRLWNSVMYYPSIIASEPQDGRAECLYYLGRFGWGLATLDLNVDEPFVPNVHVGKETGLTDSLRSRYVSDLNKALDQRRGMAKHLLRVQNWTRKVILHRQTWSDAEMRILAMGLYLLTNYGAEIASLVALRCKDPDFTTELWSRLDIYR